MKKRKEKDFIFEVVCQPAIAGLITLIEQDSVCEEFILSIKEISDKGKSVTQLFRPESIFISL